MPAVAAVFALWCTRALSRTPTLHPPHLLVVVVAIVVVVVVVVVILLRLCRYCLQVLVVVHVSTLTPTALNFPADPPEFLLGTPPQIHLWDGVPRIGT